MTGYIAEPGHLYGVGVGPGDPGLITLRAAELIRSADVVAYHHARQRDSLSAQIAADLIPDDAIREPLVYPVTTESSDHPQGYYGAMADFYDECAQRLGAHLERGRSVVVLAEGDPLFFGSFMYVHDLLAPRHPTQIVPGVTSLSAASAAAGTGLCRHEDSLAVLPGTLPVPELARRLADCDAAVVMKLGRTFAGVREALRQAGLLERAVLVERASWEQERVIPVADVDPDHVPYMSIVVVPGEDRRADGAGRAVAENAALQSDSAGGTVYVVGLGPGDDDWLTPQASRVLGEVSHVVGYAPYVDRVPPRAGLTRHPSGNTVEVDRGRLALDLARGGTDVAVVSGGDPGVFGMAAAVFEAADDPTYDSVPIRVLPGVTAAHAGSALAGAVLGADHALISLSDRLKPWEVLAERVRSCARSGLAMAFYNPRSRTRSEQLHAVRGLLLEELPGDRVVVLARKVGRAGESLDVTTLAMFDPQTVDMATLVMVGAPTTRVTRGGRVWTPRSVAADPATAAL